MMDSDDETLTQSSCEESTTKEMQRIAEKLKLKSRNISQMVKHKSNGTRKSVSHEVKAGSKVGAPSKTIQRKEAQPLVVIGSQREIHPKDDSNFAIQSDCDSSVARDCMNQEKNSTECIRPDENERKCCSGGNDDDSSTSSSSSSSASSSSSSSSSSSDSSSRESASDVEKHHGKRNSKEGMSILVSKDDTSTRGGATVSSAMVPSASLVNSYKNFKTKNDKFKRVAIQLDFEPSSPKDVGEVDVDGVPLTLKRTQSSDLQKDLSGQGIISDTHRYTNKVTQDTDNCAPSSSRFFDVSATSPKAQHGPAKQRDQGTTSQVINRESTPAAVDLTVLPRNGEIDKQHMMKQLNIPLLPVPLHKLQDEMESSSEFGMSESNCPGRDEAIYDEFVPEVDPLLYSPATYRQKKSPVVHYFSLRNRPPESRNQYPIQDYFGPPASLLWTTKFDTFNMFQSEMANHLCHSNDNIVVSAPTGAGKTTVFEMAIARFIMSDLNSNREPQRIQGRQLLSKHRKIVYIAPSKALCEERYDDWLQRFTSLNIGIVLALITGDMDAGQYYQDFASAHIILTTPEKFDGISRKWSEKFFLFASLKLLLVDEVHQLGDKSRGFCLESIITRIKTIQRGARKICVSQNDINASSYADTTPQALSSCMRIVAVSATLPNISDVAQFLDANETYAFDESYRPVPLATHVVGCGHSGKNQFMFWNSLDKHVPEYIQKYSDGKQTLIFCHTKKETERLARTLAGDPNGSSTLEVCMAKGFAWHHAGLDQNMRKNVELAFVSGRIRVLSATSSLALGVNLPARLVLVKGTKTYRGGGVGYQEVDTAQLLQMVGRAGRPGLDTRGTAVILTDHQSKEHIQGVLLGFGPAESSLRTKLLEAINGEISQFVIRSIEDAVNWLKSTFHFVRLTKHPAKYGFHNVSESFVDEQLIQTAQMAIEQLRGIGAVPGDLQNGIRPTAASHIMSQHSISFDAMKAIANLPFDARRQQILRFLSELECIQYPLRRSEKKHLNECNKKVHFKLGNPPSKFKTQSPSDKAFILLQAGIGQLYLEDFTLRQEMTSLMDQCSTILTAAHLFSVKGSGHGHVALQCFKLKRSLYACLWGETSGVLNQIPGLGQQCTQILKMNGITTFTDVLSASDEIVGKACGRGIPFANELRAKVSQLLSDALEIHASIEYENGRNSKPVGVVCKILPAKNAPNFSGKKSGSGLRYILLAHTDRPGTCLFFQEEIASPGTFSFPCPKKFGKIFVHLVASMIGLDETVELDGNSDIHPSSFVGEVEETSEAVANPNSTPPQKTKQSQTDIRRSFKKTQGTKSNPHKTETTHRRPRAKSEVRDASLARTESANTGMSVPRRNKQCSRATISPSPVPLPNPKETKTRTPTHVNGNQHITPDARHSGVAVPKHVMSPGTVDDEHNTPPQFHRMQHQSANGRQQHQRMHPTVTNTTQTSRKRGPGTAFSPYQAVSSWNHSKRKHEKVQRRAFSQKQDNPFAAFRHDPNNSESYLAALSTEPSAASVIPQKERSRLQQKVAGTLKPRMAVPNQFNKRARGSLRRRRTNHETDIEILRSKNDEMNARATMAKPYSVSSTMPRNMIVSYPPSQMAQGGVRYQQQNRGWQNHSNDYAFSQGRSNQRGNRQGQDMYYAEFADYQQRYAGNDQEQFVDPNMAQGYDPSFDQGLGAFHVSTSPVPGFSQHLEQNPQYHSQNYPKQSDQPQSHFSQGGPALMPRAYSASPRSASPYTDTFGFTGDDQLHEPWVITSDEPDSWEYLETNEWDQSMMLDASNAHQAQPDYDVKQEWEDFEEVFFN